MQLKHSESFLSLNYNIQLTNEMAAVYEKVKW